MKWNNLIVKLFTTTLFSVRVGVISVCLCLRHHSTSHVLMVVCKYSYNLTNMLSSVQLMTTWVQNCLYFWSCAFDICRPVSGYRRPLLCLKAAWRTRRLQSIFTFTRPTWHAFTRPLWTKIFRRRWGHCCTWRRILKNWRKSRKIVSFF